MTPSPTPTPTTNACFYRDAEFNGETVHVLVDAFGRMLVQDSETDLQGMAWNENGVTPEFETNGYYVAQFNAIRTAFGESDVITDITDNSVTFTDAEGGSVLLSFDNENKRFIPIVSEIENGTPNMFFRTVNDGNADVTFVCDADGKVCYFGAGYLLLVTNGDEITQSSDGALLSRLYNACGGSTEITNHVSADGDYNKYTLDEFSFVTDAHGGVTFGIVGAWTIPIHYRLYHHSEVDMYYLVDDEGHFISIATEGSQHERGYYASEENFDPIDSWDEGNVDDDVIENWGLTRVELIDSLNFNLDGVLVQYNGMGGFNMTPTEYQE